jgi:hypothetical protein
MSKFIVEVKHGYRSKNFNPRARGNQAKRAIARACGCKRRLVVSVGKAHGKLLYLANDKPVSCKRLR